jgi:fluoride exporter
MGFFPLGTLLANLLGCVSYAFFLIWLQCATGSETPSGFFLGANHHSTLFWVISGLTTGLCGTISTVSTMINECHGLPLRYSYTYGAFTFGLSYLSLFVVFALYYWAIGECSIIS